MKKIYIISLQPYAGKNFSSIGIINSLIENNYRTGYIKPVGNLPKIINGNIYDESALLIKDIFSLKEENNVVSPFVLTYDVVHSILKEPQKQAIFKQKIFDAIYSVKDKDYLIISGAGDLFTGSTVGLFSLKIAKEIKTKILLVESFNIDLSLDNIIGLKSILSDDFLGCIINKVPENLENHVSKEIIPFLEKEKIKVFAYFLKDKFLEALTIRELVDVLNGKVLCCEDRLDEFVENYSIGAMDVDNALRYFKIKPNKAVITGVHRTDIQLAALETSTKVLILTGGTGVNDIVLAKAISCGVPLVLVEEDTFSVVTKIELLAERGRIKENKKIEKIKNLFKEKFDLKKFLSSM
ncbi:MAG: DRTGG domain-containing protein [Endomicrobiia bacterium]